MQREKFEYMLANVPGVGIEAVTRNGDTHLGFYEDFPGSAGIDRAAPQMYKALKAGDFSRVTFLVGASPQAQL